MDKPLIRILMVDDDPDDHVLFRHMLNEISNFRFDVDFVTSYEAGLEWMNHHSCDLVFVDYSLGEKTGLDLIPELHNRGFNSPVIMFTGRGNPDVDKRAMAEGAADYLEKTGLTHHLLERTIRYALERHRTLSLLQERQEQLERVSKKLLTIQEKERDRIARELHDSTGSTLTAIKYALEEKCYYQQNGSLSEGTALEEIIGWVRLTMDEVRATCSRLRPPLLADKGLSAAIDSLCKKTRQVSENLEIIKRVQANEENISEELKTAVYRILQEALNNVSKHSNATRAEIHLEEGQDGLALSIRDNGIGFLPDGESDASAGGEGLGLESMRDRTEFLSGLFEIQSRPNHGTHIKCFWPNG